MTLHCKKCGGLAFRDIASLRRHQWAQHREAFHHLLTASKRPKGSRKKRGRPRKEAEIAVIPFNPPTNGRAPMLASELLAKLKTMQQSITDTVGLVAGLIAQHGDHK